MHAPLLSIIKTVINTEKNFEFDMFNNFEKIKNLNIPILIIHSRNDSTIYLNDAEKLFNSIKNNNIHNEMIIIENGHHNISLKSNFMDCYPKISAFIQRISYNDLKLFDSKLIQKKKKIKYPRKSNSFSFIKKEYYFELNKYKRSKSINQKFTSISFKKKYLNNSNIKQNNIKSNLKIDDININIDVK